MIFNRLEKSHSGISGGIETRTCLNQMIQCMQAPKVVDDLLKMADLDSYLSELHEWSKMKGRLQRLYWEVDVSLLSIYIRNYRLHMQRRYIYIENTVSRISSKCPLQFSTMV